MPRDGVPYEAVAETADALSAEGVKPHTRLVRERLGSTGSSSTIHRHLTRWRAEQPLGLKDGELPSEMLEALKGEIARRERLCTERLDARFKESLQELSELLEAAERENETLTEALAALKRERDTLTGKSTEQAEVIERQHLALESLHAELNALIRQNAETKSSKEQLEVTAGELKATLESAQHTVHHLQDALNLKEREHTEALCELSASRRTESASTEELKRLRELYAQSDAQREALASRLETLNTELLSRTERLAHAEGELKLARQACAYTEERLTQTTDALTHERARCAALEKENRQLQHPSDPCSTT